MNTQIDALVASILGGINRAKALRLKGLKAQVVAVKLVPIKLHRYEITDQDLEAIVTQVDLLDYATLSKRIGSSLVKWVSDMDGNICVPWGNWDWNTGFIKGSPDGYRVVGAVCISLTFPPTTEHHSGAYAYVLPKGHATISVPIVVQKDDAELALKRVKLSSLSGTAAYLTFSLN